MHSTFSDFNLGVFHQLTFQFLFFQVKHFTKYGMDESDEDDLSELAQHQAKMQVSRWQPELNTIHKHFMRIIPYHEWSLLVDGKKCTLSGIDWDKIFNFQDLTNSCWKFFFFLFLLSLMCHSLSWLIWDRYTSTDGLKK